MAPRSRRKVSSPYCRIVLLDDVTPAATVIKRSACTAEEAMEFDGDLAAAQQFILFGDPTDSPIGVSIQTRPDQVTVHWHTIGDPDAARAALAEVRSGSGEVEL